MEHTRGSAAMSIAGGGFQRPARRDSQQQKQQPAGSSSSPAASVVISAEQTAVAQHNKADELKQATTTSERQQAIVPAAAVWSPVSTAPSAPDAPPDQQQQQQHQPGDVQADSPHGSSADAESDGEESGGSDSYVISAAEVALAQRLQADHRQRGERIAELESQAAEWRNKISKLQSVIEALEQERMDESAR
jgi:hypothetical protein